MIIMILLVFAFVLATVEAVRGYLGLTSSLHLGWLAVALFILVYIVQAAGIR